MRLHWITSSWLTYESPFQFWRQYPRHPSHRSFNWCSSQQHSSHVQLHNDSQQWCVSEKNCLDSSDTFGSVCLLHTRCNSASFRRCADLDRLELNRKFYRSKGNLKRRLPLCCASTWLRWSTSQSFTLQSWAGWVWGLEPRVSPCQQSSFSYSSRESKLKRLWLESCWRVIIYGASQQLRWSIDLSCQKFHSPRIGMRYCR